MSNAEHPDRKDERKKQSDAGVERMHIERQPAPGHTENIPVDGDMRQAPGASPIDGPVAGPVEDVAPTADPETKSATPPGTQSERDRLRGES
jgi:hypothetical protein